MRKHVKYIFASGLFIYAVAWLFHVIFQTTLFPNPNTIIMISIRDFNKYVPHLLVSGYRILISMSVALIVGVLIGLLMGVVPSVKKILNPLVYTLYPIPKIAFLPVFMLLFGIKDFSKILLIVTIIIFQFIIATVDAVEAIDNDILKAAKIMKVPKSSMFKSVYLPAILPNVLTACRNAFGMSIAVLFFAENYATTYGMGYTIMNSWMMVQYKDMYAGILLLSIFGLLVFILIDYLEMRLIRWR